MNTTAPSVRERHRGFTLLELMTVLAVLGVMVAFAAPNFREYKRNAALTNTANTLVSSVYRTRSEAMKEGVPAIMMPCNDDCTGTGTDWTQGWVIFLDRNLNDAYDAGDAGDGPFVFVQSGEEIPSDYITIENSNSDGFVKFNGAGFPRKKSSGTKSAAAGFGALTLTVKRTDKEGDRYIRRIVLSGSGRVRTCRPDVDTKCKVEK